MDPLFLDMTCQPRYLLTQTNIHLKLLPAKADFALQAVGTPKGYDYQIENCVLYVRRINVIDTVISGHNKGLDKHNAKFFFESYRHFNPDHHKGRSYVYERWPVCDKNAENDCSWFIKT